MYEDQGDAYAFFRPALAKTTLGFTWNNPSTLPSKWYLYLGNCGNFTQVSEGSFFADENNALYFVFDSLLVGKDYYVRLEGNPGDDFTILGYLTETIHASGTCTSVGCNVIQNPSFDEVEFGINVGNPVGGVLGPQNGAGFIDEACGWDFISFANNQPNVIGCNSPDYYRTAQNSMYAPALPCASATAIGNSCTSAVATHTGQGVAQLVTADIRTNSLANRREYMHTQLNTPVGSSMPVQTGKIYYTSMWARPNTDRRLRNPALQFLVIDNTTMQNNLPQNCQAILNWGTPMADFSTQLNSLNSNWQNAAQLVQYTGADADILVIGNFLSPAASDALNIEDVTNPWNQVPDSVPSWFIDDVEIILMPDAGSNITVCAGEPVTLGWQPTCMPSGVTYQWWDWSLSTQLATTANLTINALAGVNTYILQIYYQGQGILSSVTVTGLPGAPLNISPINQTICNGNLSFIITDYDPNNLNYTVSTTGLNGSGQIDGNGNLNFGSVEFTNPLGMATVTIIANNPLSNCQNSQTFTVYDCCNEQPTGIPVFNERFSTFNQGTNGLNYIIYGSVLLDDNYTFTDCNFYLQPDAELVAMADLNIEFQNCTFQACNEFKWDRFNEHASTSITFTDCQIGEGLRALHTESDAQLSVNGTLFSDNTLSQLARSYATGSALSWQTNTYTMYPLNSITQQHPLSTIPMGTILNNSNYQVVGVKFDEALDFNLANGNTFWSDCGTTPVYDYYLHVWLTQSSLGTIDGNTFNEGMNVYVHQNSTATITNNYFQKSAQPNGAPGGIKAHGSTVTIGDLNASTFSNYLFDGASIFIENPIESYIYKNQILHNTLSEAIKITATTLSSSRTLIHENEITAKTCILINNLKSDWQSSSNQKVYVHDNDLFPTKSSNTSGNGNIAVGVSAFNCEGISIGENTITHVYATGVTLPDATNNYQSVGIQLTNCRNAFVGCNDILYAGRGLAFSGDVTRNSWLDYDHNGSPVFPIQFQSNKFMNYYFGIYIGIGTTISSIGQDDPNPIPNPDIILASDNEWLQVLGLPISSADRVKDDRVNQTTSDNIYIYYTGLNNTTNTKYPDAPNSPYISRVQLGSQYANPDCVIDVPSNKTSTTQPDASLVLYPNPVAADLNYVINLGEEANAFNSVHISIIDMSGKMHLDFENAEHEGSVHLEGLPRGMYIFKAVSGTQVHVARFVRY